MFPSGRWAGAVALATAAFGITYVAAVGSGYLVYITSLTAVYIISVTGYNLVFGLAKQFTLAHTAVFGIGAYATAYLVKQVELPRAIAVVASVGIAAAVAALVSLVAWRVSDLHLALVTFAVLSLVLIAFQRARPYTGGNIGQSLTYGEGLTAHRLLVLTTVLGMLSVAGASAIKRSPWGRRWIALGDSEIAAESMGIDRRAQKVVVFAVSGAFAGLAGALYMQVVQYVTPESFGFESLTMLLVAVTVGRSGHLLGGATAMAVLVFASERLRGHPSIESIAYGVALIAALALTSSRPELKRLAAVRRVGAR